MADITVVTLAHFDKGRLLMVRKAGQENAILPGGKPERGEDDADTLAREIREELGCSIDRDSMCYLGRFRDVVVTGGDITVEVRLYGAQISGTPTACSEIVELIWVDPNDPRGGPFAPSMVNQIFRVFATRPRQATFGMPKDRDHGDARGARS